MQVERTWREYLCTLSPAELEQSKQELEFEVKANGEMSESARLGYLPHGASEADYEHEANEAEWRLRWVNEFLKLHQWANSKIGTILGKGTRARKIVSYYVGTNGTGVYFNCAHCGYPTYQLLPKDFELKEAGTWLPQPNTCIINKSLKV